MEYWLVNSGTEIIKLLEILEERGIFNMTIKEEDLEFLKVPNGYPPEDRIHRLLDRNNEPPLEVIEEFFKPHVIRRLVYCPGNK